MLLAASGPFWMPSLDSMVHVAPLGALAGTIVAILLAAMIFGRSPSVSALVTIVGAAATAVVCFLRATHTAFGSWAGLAPDGSPPMLLMDNFAIAFITLLCLFLACVVGLWIVGTSSGSPDREAYSKDSPEFFTLLVGSAFGMALMVCTTNLLMIILAIEMASLPSYAIVGFRKRNRVAAEASLKYVLFGAVTSALMIYGVSLLYGFYGTLDAVTIGQKIAGYKTAGTAMQTGTNLLMAVALLGLLAGIAFKISAVPFHFWCPDVFEGASIEVTTWLSVASKAAALGLLFRLVTSFVQPLEDTSVLVPMSTAIGIFAAVTCTWGNLAAFRQENLKRLLAYSSIAHAGYMLMAGAILWQYRPGVDPANPAFMALIAYIIVYLFMNLGAFGAVALVYWATGKETLDAFTGLGRRAPWVALSLTICLFSLVGLPPLGGFIAKFYLLWALYKGGLVWLIFVAVLNTLMSLYYYSRVAYQMYFRDDGQPAIATSPAGRVLIGAAAAIILLIGAPLAGGLKQQADRFAEHLYPVAIRAGSVEEARASQTPPVVAADATSASVGTPHR